MHGFVDRNITPNVSIIGARRKPNMALIIDNPNADTMSRPHQQGCNNNNNNNDIEKAEDKEKERNVPPTSPTYPTTWKSE